MNRGAILASIEKAYFKSKRIPTFSAGDVVKVHLTIKEGEKERIQVFEGVVIGRRGDGIRETFKVRRIASGVGVERTFVLHSPLIAKLEIVKRGQVHRAKLYYLRTKTGKHSRIRELQREKLLQIQEADRKALEEEQTRSALEAAAEAAAREAEAKAANAAVPAEPVEA